MSQTPNKRLYVVLGLISVLGLLPTIVQISLAIDSFVKNEDDLGEKLMAGACGTCVATTASIIGLYKWRVNSQQKTTALLNINNPEEKV